MLSAEAQELLDAWQAWDDACSRVSDNKGLGVTSLTLKREADRMEDAAAAYAERIGLRATAFRAVLAAWRQAGLDRPTSLEALEFGLKARSTPPA